MFSTNVAWGVYIETERDREKEKREREKRVCIEFELKVTNSLPGINFLLGKHAILINFHNQFSIII